MRACSRQPPCGDQDLGRGQHAHHDSMDTCDARWPPRRPGRPSAEYGRPPNSGPLRRALRTTPLRRSAAPGLLTGSAPGNVMCHAYSAGHGQTAQQV
jgi:hypothetical protein